jgi:hypothetical protein
MPESASNTHTDAELAAEFDRLFPQGFAGPDVVQELAPKGWENSPLLAVFHPSLEQVYEETLRIHRNLADLRKPDDARPLPPEPTLDEIAKDRQESAIEVAREVGELVGQCLWDIFSDNHEVVSADGRVLDLGSFRYAGGILADLLNRQTGSQNYDYINFYLGTIWISQRADLAPVYQMIFGRLRKQGFDWVYHFPRLYAIDLSPLKESLERKDQPEWADYDPSKALAKEEEEKQRQKELAEFRESLDKGHREAIQEARKGPPPTTVQAYQRVYGRNPRGWPPSV